MNLDFEYFDNRVELLPSLSLGAMTCESCDTDHGWCIALSWLCWAIILSFPSSHDEDDDLL